MSRHHRRRRAFDKSPTRAGRQHALLDAAALSHALATASGVEDALDLYVRARRLHVRVFQAMSFMFTPFYQSDSTLLPLFRDRLMATIAKIPPAPRLLASMVAGTLVDPFRKIGLKEVDWRAATSAPAGFAELDSPRRANPSVGACLDELHYVGLHFMPLRSALAMQSARFEYPCNDAPTIRPFEAVRRQRQPSVAT